MTHGITQTIGLDLGDKQVEYAVLADGEEDASETGRFPATRRGLERFFERAARSRVILEAGGHSRWMEALIGNLGHEPMVVDARRLPLISRSLAKTDKRDAELLAWLGRAAPKLLNQIRHRGAEAQADLAVLRTRQNLVQARTSLICAAGRFILSALGKTSDRMIGMRLLWALSPASRSRMLCSIISGVAPSSRSLVPMSRTTADG